MSSPATSLQKQIRVGVAVLPTDGLTLAMDIDLDRSTSGTAFVEISRWAVRAAWDAAWPFARVCAGVWKDSSVQSWREAQASSFFVRVCGSMAITACGRTGEDRGLGAAMRAGF